MSSRCWQSDSVTRTGTSAASEPSPYRLLANAGYRAGLCWPSVMGLLVHICWPQPQAPLPPFPNPESVWLCVMYLFVYICWPLTLSLPSPRFRDPEFGHLSCFYSCIYANPNPSLPSPLPFRDPESVFCVCESVSVLHKSSFVSFFKIPEWHHVIFAFLHLVYFT